MPTLLDEKRDGDIRISSRGGNVVIEETWNFIVRADDKRQTRTEIAATAGLPLVNFTLSAGGLAVCKTKICNRRADNPLYWDVTCTFSSEVEESNNNANQMTTDPTTWVVTRKTIFFNKPSYSLLDASGDPMQNSAGQPFPALPKVRTLVAWRFAQFELPSVTDETIADRNEKVNASTFKGKAAKTLLLTVEDSMLGYYYGRYLRLTQYLLKYDPDTWVLKRYDVGTCYLSGGQPFPFMDKAGNLVGGDIPLDGAGGPAGGFAADGRPKFGAPSILSFDEYATNSFSFLRI